MSFYQPYALHGDNFSGGGSAYAVRVGGSGGRIIGRGWELSRARAIELCEHLEAAREAGREEAMEA